MKQNNIVKMKQKRLGAITLQGAREKNLWLISILEAQVIFSLTVSNILYGL